MEEFLDFGGIGQHLNRLNPEEKAISYAIMFTAFHRILAGKKSTSDELALETGITANRVQQYVEDMAGKGMLAIDGQGDVVGSYGLSLIPSDHRLIINGQNLFTWCAIDAVGIPAALGVDARIISSCFECEEPIEITMFGGKVHDSNPADTRIWESEPDLSRSIAGYT